MKNIFLGKFAYMWWRLQAWRRIRRCHCMTVSRIINDRMQRRRHFLTENDGWIHTKENIQDDRFGTKPRSLIRRQHIRGKNQRWGWNESNFLHKNRQRPLFFICLNRPFSASFYIYFLCLSFKQLTKNKCSTKVTGDWIRTRVLWYFNWSRCQLCHNHCP